MWSDLRYGLRQWRKDRAVTAIVVLLLGAGIGANAVIFGFVNAVLLKPLPIRDPSNLFLVEKMRIQQLRPDTSYFYRVYEQIRTRTDLFKSAVAVQELTENSFQPINSNGAVKMVSTEIVSSNYFSVLGVKPTLGRLFTARDVEGTSDIPIVLSYGFWVSQMNGDRNVIGHMLRIKNYPFRIAGVLPQSFHGIDIDRSPDVRLPISAAPILSGHTVFEPNPASPMEFQILVRIASGASPTAASAAVTRAIQNTDAASLRSVLTQTSNSISQTELDQWIRLTTSYRIKLENIKKGISRMRDQFIIALYVLMGAAGILLLAVCASVSGLLLARAERRTREVAIRVAVGASRARLLRQVSFETLLLAIPSASLAVFFAYAVSPILVRLLPEMRGMTASMYATKPVIDVSLDHRGILFVIAVCIIAVFVSGVGPALRTIQVDVNEDLRRNQSSGSSIISGVVVVAIQVSLCVVLAAGAALLLRTFWNLEHLNPGFDRAHIIEVDLDPEAAGYSEAQAALFLREIRTQVAVVPGVRSVASAVMGVMHGVGMKTTMAPQGVILPKKTFMNVNTNMVSPEYFQTLGIPLLAGRALEENDRKIKPEPIVINTALAKLFFPHKNPIGRGLVGGSNGNKPSGVTIVGVVGTAKYRSLREENPPIVYSLENKYFLGKALYVRTFGNPEFLVGEIGKLIHARDPGVPIVAISTIEQEVQNSLWQERLLALLAAFFGAVSLALAAAGIYGVLAYSVTIRTREIGIRLSVGAAASDIIRTVCGRLSMAVGTGLIFGIAVSAFLLKLARQLFFGVQGLDPVTFLLTTLGILALGFAAAVLPVLRAVRTDPVTAIRSE